MQFEIMILFPDIRASLSARQFKDFRKILRAFTTYSRLKQVPITIMPQIYLPLPL
jgi:hypothetical protein